VPTVRCILGPLATPAACDPGALVTPAATLGAKCADSADCTAGFCFGRTRECSTCRAYGAPGQPCTLVDQLCDPATAWCAEPLDGGARTCAAKLTDGTACGGNGQCATGWCNWLSNAPDAGTDTCGHLPVGAPCGDAEGCVADAYCAGYWFDGTTTTPGVCTVRIAVGQPCANHPEDDGCAAGATCLEGVCTAQPDYDLDAGAECEDLGDCAEPFFCKGYDDLQPDGGPSLRSGVCTPRLAPGAPCDFTTYVDTDCEQSATCGNNYDCVARGDAGSQCEASWECLDFLACPLSGRCEPFRTVGASCSTGARCADGARDGLCERDGGVGTCVAKYGDGVACSPLALNQCASDRCFAEDGGAPVCQAACLP